MSIPLRMQAIRKIAPAPGPDATRLEEIPVPVPGPGEALLKVLATAMCGTDRHIYHWKPSVSGSIQTPLTYGHEFCGEVALLGPDPGRQDLAEGDYVSAEMHVICGECRACRAGQSHACQKTRILGLHGEGCFAEYVVVPARNIVKLDAKVVPPRIGAFLDALGNAVHTTEYAPLPGSTVAVFGYGPIGAMGAAIAAHQKAAGIYILDVNPHSIARAERWKKDHQLDQVEVIQITPNSNPVQEVLASSSGGVDIALEMSGAESAVNQALAITRNGGHVSLLGLPRTNRLTIENYSHDVIFKGITMQAIIGRRIFETWDRMLDLLRDGLDVSFLVSEEHDSLEKFHDGMATFDRGDALKVIYYPHGRPE